MGKKSKITLDTLPKEKLVAVRLDAILARELEKYQSKTEVITAALEEYLCLHRVCPKCNGSGKVKFRSKLRSRN